MGFLGTALGTIGNFLKSPVGASIAGGLTNVATNALNSTIQSAITQGSASSAVSQQSSGNSTSTLTQNQNAWGQSSQTGGVEGSSEQMGSVQGIANALMSALSTPTGNNAGSAAQFNQMSAQTANNLQSNQWTAANLMNMMSSSIANILNAESQSSAMKYNAEQNQIARDFNAAQSKETRKWQRQMRQTAYQDTVKDLQKAGLNPILAATNGATGNYSGAEASSGAASIGAQSYNQATAAGVPSAHTSTMQAMYDYGNNTSQFIDNMLQAINTAKQYGYNKEASWMEQAFTEGAATSAKTIESYASQGSQSTSSSYTDRYGNNQKSSNTTDSKTKTLNGEAHIGSK